MLRQEARIRRLTEAPEQRRRAFDVREEKRQSSRGTKPKLNRQSVAVQRPGDAVSGLRRQRRAVQQRPPSPGPCMPVTIPAPGPAYPGAGSLGSGDVASWGSPLRP